MTRRSTTPGEPLRREPAAPELEAPELDAVWGHPLARRILRTAQRLRRAVGEHPLLLDTLLALALLTSGLVNVASPDTAAAASVAPAPVAVAVAVQTLPLVWRRRAPLAVFAAVLLGSVVQWSLGVNMRSTLSLMIALYTLARYDHPRRLPWAASGTAAGISLAAFRVKPFNIQPWTSLFLLASAVTAAIALGLAVRVRQAQLRALADRAARLETEREQRAQLATLAERTRISREMHDIVGHNLAVIVGLADGGAALAATDPARSAEALRIIAGTGRQALSELRRTLGALREQPDDQSAPAVAAELNPQPGIADLPVLLERIRAAGPRITYRTAGELAALAPGVQLAVYRIVQEALTNSLKHAGAAATVTVTLRATAAEVELRVQDSGRPDIAPTGGNRSGNGNGQGLVGIRERAALAGGVAEAGPSGTGGWLVHAVLPLAPRPSQEAGPRVADQEAAPESSEEDRS
ncbi:sensor histidine kinase [Streptomyces sp. NPDC054933]